MYEDLIKALRWIARNDEAVFDAEQAKLAAEVIKSMNAEIARLKEERDALMKRHHHQVETIRKIIDTVGLADDEKRLLSDLNFETNYDRRTAREE